MPAPLLLGALSLAVIVPLIVKVLVAIGVGFVSYAGADYVITAGETYVMSQFGGMPSDLYQVLLLFGFRDGVSMVFAAFAANISIKVTMGVFTRMKITAPGA